MQSVEAGDDTSQRPEHSATVRMAWISWSHLLNDGSTFYLPGVLSAILVSIHEPLASAGLIVGSLYFWQTMQPLAGVMADTIGGPWFITLGLLGAVCGAGLIGLAGNLPMLILCLVITGIGSAVFHPSALKAARGVLLDRPGFGLSIFLVGGELGRGLWPTLAGLIVKNIGLKALWLTAVPALCTLPFIYHYLPTMPPRHRHAEKIQWRRHAGPVALLMAFSGLRALLMYGVTTYVPILWRFRGGSLVGGAAILTTMLEVGIIGNLSGGLLVDRFGRRPLLLISSALLIALTPILYWSRGPATFAVAGLFGIALFSTFSSTLVIGQDIFPENRALGSGIALGLSNATGALLLMPLGLLARSHNLTFLFEIFTCAAVGMLLLATLLIIPNASPSRPA